VFEELPDALPGHEFDRAAQESPVAANPGQDVRG